MLLQAVSDATVRNFLHFFEEHRNGSVIENEECFGLIFSRPVAGCINCLHFKTGPNFLKSVT